MQAGQPIKDTGTVNGLQWIVEGLFHGSKGLYELAIDPEANTIVHYLFKSIS